MPDTDARPADYCLQAAARLRARGDLAAATVCYEQALAANPNHWDALYLYGTALLQFGKLREAIGVFNRATTLRPDVADVQNNLGVAHQALGDFDAAHRAYQSAIDLKPDFTLAHANLARLLESVGRWAEAETALRIALDADPRNFELQISLAAALVNQGRLDAAANAYRAVLDVRPDSAEVHSSLAFVFEQQGQLDDALKAAERAVELRPDYAEGFNNLGIALRSLHRLDDACGAFRTAVQLKPTFALAEFNLGTTLLLAGRYAEGWPGYRQHARLTGAPAPGSPATEWDGQPIPGWRLLVFADQGLGDTIQFVRFLPLCKEQSQATIVLRCQSPLMRLLTQSRGVDELQSAEDEPPAFESQISLAALPGLFGLSIDQVVGGVPYLRGSSSMPAPVRELLSTVASERRVGLVWQGNPRQTRDAVRSCPLEKLAPLLQVAGIRFFSLQTDALGRAQLKKSSFLGRLPDVGQSLDDFATTAAVLEELDLLITVDTAIAHLAGALGRPVWTILCHTPDWRWHLDRTDSPWYSTMRLFRQPAWGDWDSVVEQVRNSLERL